MYCPNCNNFVDDSRQNCPFCNAQIHNIEHVNTTERHVMEKIVGSRLYVIMAVAFTLYLVFMAMTVVLDVFGGGGFDIFNILLTVFGGILTWRIWTLYMGAVKKAPENPRAEKMTAFFTCQKVLCIILAVLLGLGTLAMLAVTPFAGILGNTVDKLVYEDYTMKDVIYDLSENEEEAELAYSQFELSEDFSEEDFRKALDEIKEEIDENDMLSSFVKKYSFSNIIRILMFVIVVGFALATIVYILFAVYMAKAVTFLTDFSFTWNGYAPWRRGARYAVGLGYFLSVVLFIVALFSITLIPYDFSLLIYLSASVALFCFSKFTSKIQKTMDELYRLNI